MIKKPSTIEIIGALGILLLIAIYLVLSEMLTLKAIETLRGRGLLEPDFDDMPHAKIVTNEPEFEMEN